MREAAVNQMPDDFDLPLLMEVTQVNGSVIGEDYCRFGEITSFSKDRVKFNYPKLIRKNDEVTVFIKDPKKTELNEVMARLKITAIKMKEFLSNEYCCQIEKMIMDDLGGALKPEG